jgi:plasmid stability protein
MASVTLELPDETRRRLEAKAARNGQPLEAYIREVLEAEAAPPGAGPRMTEAPPPISRLSLEEFDRRLDALKERKLPVFPPLPADFSRADIYDDHD